MALALEGGPYESSRLSTGCLERSDAPGVLSTRKLRPRFSTGRLVQMRLLASPEGTCDNRASMASTWTFADVKLSARMATYEVVPKVLKSEPPEGTRVPGADHR